MTEHTESYVRLFTNLHRAEKQYRNPLEKGDTVRIVCDVCQGLIGELKTIDPEEPDENFFGVALDAIEGWIFFRADEIEKVEAEEDPHIPWEIEYADTAWQLENSVDEELPF